MWSPQQYLSSGKAAGFKEDQLNEAIKQINNVLDLNPTLPSVLTLNHLAIRTKVSHSELRSFVERKEEDSYRKFSIKKRSGGRRFIHVPNPVLKQVQQWINIFILRHVTPHACSYAFSPKSSIYKCANKHTGAKWLIKMDIMGFFESISEIQVYRVFKKLGYQPLVAFELARITTVPIRDLSPRLGNPTWMIKSHNAKIPTYTGSVLGYLPQGAPTSPMLANLVMNEIDNKILSVAQKAGLTYTRYSDDLTFSTRDKMFSRKEAQKAIVEIGKILSAHGFKPQWRKTVVVPPGSRKIVLGLLVDGDTPKLSKEFKDRLRQHFYYMNERGPIEHASTRKFESVLGLKNHIKGLVDYANMVEPDYAKKLYDQFNLIEWPI